LGCNAVKPRRKEHNENSKRYIETGKSGPRTWFIYRAGIFRMVFKFCFYLKKKKKKTVLSLWLRPWTELTVLALSNLNCSHICTF
jgi:hypothetical protein